VVATRVSLGTYRAKRDAAKTPEPVPDEAGPEVDHTGDEQGERGNRFVIQEHHATALHWDVRLQRDGVLVSWAVPKGLPLDPATNHLAKQTEDHPEQYETFSGEIPKGEYGAGTMFIWDSGTYELEKWRDREVMLVFHGTRTEGKYVFFRTRGNDWMVHRMDPAPEGWSPLPQGLTPMQPTESRMPADDKNWSYEVAWSGERVLIAVDGGRLHITSGEKDVTGQYPELRGLGLQLGSRQVLLDGELIAFGNDGRPDADRLAKRRTTKATPAVVRSTPVQLLVYDVLHAEGVPLLDLSYVDRRKALEELEIGGEHWLVPDTFHGGGRDVLNAARKQGLAGIVSKKRNSRYEPGMTSRNWRLIC
jgi:bifunctional non-homologous end joining protein LigD